MSDAPADAAREALRRVRARCAERVEAATRHLREVNLAEFRDRMRGVFAAHPVLETVRFEQVAMYNDEYNALSQSEMWINGRQIGAGMLYDVVLGRGGTLHERVLEVGRADDPVAAALYRRLEDARWPIGRDRDETEFQREAERAADALRAHVGPPYVAAEAVVEAMLGLYARYGAHFFWDAFGSRATVEVEREAIRISEAVENEDAYVWSDLYSDDARSMLGPLREPYLDAPERHGQAALREVAIAESRRAEHRWMEGHFWTAADRVRKTLYAEPGSGPEAFARANAPVAFVWRGGVHAVRLGGLEMRVRGVRSGGGWTYACVEEPPEERASGVGGFVRAAFAARRPDPSLEEHDAALAARHGEAVRRAARLWLDVLRDALDEVGHDAFDSLPARPPDEKHLFTF